MVYALVEYRIKNGKIVMKAVTSQEALDEMISKLDSRIEKGTCFGYIATIM